MGTFRKIFIVVLSLVFAVGLLGMSSRSVDAYYGSGEYINIYGWPGNPISCKNPDSCNQYHVAGVNCDPDRGLCDASKTTAASLISLPIAQTCSTAKQGSCPAGSTSTGTYTCDTGCILCKVDSGPDAGEIFSAASCSTGSGCNAADPAAFCGGRDTTCPPGEEFEKWTCTEQNNCAHTCKTSGSGKWWVFKWVCDGKAPDAKCGGGQLQARRVKKAEGGTLKVDGDGVKCGQTVQLDVYDKDPEAGGGWDQTAETKDYMVWYSGDCAGTTPPACGADCSSDPNICTSISGCNVCNPTSKKCEAPPGTTPPVCGADCSSDPNICNNISGCNVCNPTSKKCEAPPGTTPGTTPPVACGQDCSTNPNICQQNGSSCNVCDTNTKKCVGPGTTPGTTPPVACGQDCSTNPNICQQNGSSCNVCDTNTKKCVAPPTQVPPSPTPDFNPAMCKCDGIDATAIISGQAATFTAYAKVLGQDISKAQVKSISFNMAKGNDLTASIISKSGPIQSSVVSSSPDLVRYKSAWNTTVPQLESGVTYTVFANIECVRKSASAFNYIPTSDSQTAVMGAETQKEEGFFAKVANFFKGLFGIKSPEPVAQPKPSATPQPTLPDADVQANPNPRQIQLGTFKPAQVLVKACYIMKFKAVD